MSITLELAPEVEARLRSKAAQQGQDVAAYLLDVAERDGAALDAEAEDTDTAEGTAYDLFAGHIGRIHGSTEALSQNCGERFTEYVVAKHEAEQG